MHASITGSVDPWDADKTLTATMANGNLVIHGVEKSGIAITLTVYDAAVGQFSAVGGEPVPSLEATFGNDRTFSYTSAGMGGSIRATISELTAAKAVGTFEFLAFPQFLDDLGTPTYRVVGGTFNVTIR